MFLRLRRVTKTEDLGHEVEADPVFREVADLAGEEVVFKKLFAFIMVIAIKVNLRLGDDLLLAVKEICEAIAETEAGELKRLVVERLEIIGRVAYAILA